MGVLAQAIQSLIGKGTTPPSPTPPTAPTPDRLLQQILSQNKGFSAAFPPGSVEAVLASLNRTKQAAKQEPGSSLEFWPPQETGDPSFPRPAGYDGKSLLEIYSPALKKDPSQLSDAIYGDLLHGMKNDSYFNSLREQFIKNYPPAVADFNKKLLARGFGEDSLHDMYIRGRLAKNQGEEWNDPSRYSKKQLEILDKMRNYIRTGTKP